VRLAVLLLLTCGCRQIFGLDTPDPLRADAGGDDAPNHGDGMVATDAGLCFSRPALNLGACLAAPPTSDLMAPASTSIDTDDSTYCAVLTSSTQDMCVVAATSISVSSGAVVRITGARPLVLFSSTLIALAGSFDVASHGSTLGNLVPSAGAGEDPSVCGSVVAPTTQGGGAGGSFGTRGGDGGRGESVLSMPGQPAPALTADSFHGGCRGGVGADGAVAAAFGGGAIALFADVVALDGTINASGMGGPGAATASKGGYGGGSGGMIVISASSVMFAGQGQLFANGGAGGGGSTSSGAGDNGSEAVTFNGAIVGGMGGNNNGGAGGNAFPPASGTGQNGGGSAGAGGGGGGGAGAIVIFTNSTFPGSPRISPAPVLPGF
jgi:hypothetical protein